MRVYLDNCCLQRPLDDQTHPRIRVETEAVLAIFVAAQSEGVILLNSEAIEYEVRRIPDRQRRNETFSVLSLAKERLELTSEAEELAESLEKLGINPMDAIHLAIASTAKADFFATCDDKFLKKASIVADLNCKVISVLNLVSEIIE